MIKTNVSFIIVYFFTISLFCQVGNAVYGKQIKAFGVDKSITSDDIDLPLKKILENLKTYEYQLVFKDRKAFYKKIESMSNTVNPIIKAMTEGVAGFKGIIFYDTASDIVLHEREFAGVNYLIKRNKIDWTLTKDTLRIDNYVCFKAKTTVFIKNSEGEHELEAIAWYAPEIPIPYGPDGYGGLPGLVLQLDFNGTITSLKKIEFFKDEDKVEDIDLPTKTKKVSEDEFNSIASKLYENRKNRH